MSSRIEDYALIGDCQTAALVARNGSIDWLCFPRFDSGACFAALLGRPEHGRWQLAPVDPPIRTERRYAGDTLVLETIFTTEQGEVALVDCMPPRSREPNLVRIVVGRRGTVKMRMHLVIRFDYGSVVPWVRRTDRGIRAIAGPDQVELQTSVDLRGEGLTTVADFTVVEGQRVPFVLQWQPSQEEPHEPVDAEQACRDTGAWWEAWSARCRYDGPYRSVVRRSLMTLKALTYAPTGGIVPAATTSLPEQLGGMRNWDYRLCWLRDATFTLDALMNGGFEEEAIAWRSWLLRAVAGDPSQINIVYGLAGERRLPEIELPWLPGYEGSSPVRIGNAAYKQQQLDIFGELMDALHSSRVHALNGDESAWPLQRHLIEHLEQIWRDSDEGIWEVRGPRRHFTQSKVMAWVAVDRMVKDAERFKLAGPTGHWRQLRTAIHADVCRNGFNRALNSFVQYYGASETDASLLMLPLVGFLSPLDPRIRGTVERIEQTLAHDGLVNRYLTREAIDGLPPCEGAFLPCSFWLADNYQLLGRHAEAEALFERLLGLTNDVGLLSEEYDPIHERLLGNFPQAFSHVALINTAMNLAPHGASPASHRGRRGG
jgi:GH15 family glucan-1,4-alpha-glucosidase